MKLSEGVEQAIHCMTFLSGLSEQGVLSAAALAELHGVSASYLLKHLQALSGAGLLLTVPGPKGGYRLAKAPHEISLLDIVLAVEGPEPAYRCAEIRRGGPNPLPASAYIRPCGINVAMLKAEKAYRAALAEVRLSDIVADFLEEADPRSIARSCAFVERHQRMQKSVSKQG